MKPYQKRTQRDYTFASKLAIVDQIKKGDMTYSQAQNGLEERMILAIQRADYLEAKKPLGYRYTGGSGG